MASNKKDYISIIKSNSIFGSVKIFQVLISILKVKIVAILLGPAGVGIQTLLVSSLATMHQFTNLGVSQSSVREISIQKDGKNRNEVIQTINVLAVVLGVFASLFCFFCAKFLSKLVYGTEDYKYLFLIVSVSLFFESVSNIQISILQGLRKVKILAKASLIGAIISLILTVPLYYYWKTEAIPYAIAIGFIIPGIVYVCYQREQNFKATCKLSLKQYRMIGSPIVRLGVTLMLGNCIMSLFTLGLNMFINHLGGSSAVGFYQAASVCTYSAINIIVAILASDYYPRLASFIEDYEKVEEIISTQVELLLLVLAPVVCVMIMKPDLFVWLLYSSDFLSISYVVQIMSISLFFRVVWHSMSYVILAKGDKKAYLQIDALLGNGLFFISNIIGYYTYGLTGLGYSYVVSSFLVMLLLLLFIRHRYKYKISVVTIKTGGVLLTLCIITFICNLHITGSLLIFVNILLMLLIFFIALTILEKRTHLMSKFIKKNK